MVRPDRRASPRPLQQQPRPVLERAAVLVRALVRERREELVQQVAVGGVDLHDLEAGLERAPGRRLERRARSRRPRPWSARSGCASRPRTAARWPRPSARRPRLAVSGAPPCHGRWTLALRPACASWMRGDRALARDEARAPAQASMWPSSQMPASCGLMRPRASTAAASAITSAGPADRPAPEVDQMPVCRVAVHARVLAHRRDHDAVAKGQAAKRERLEQTRTVLARADNRSDVLLDGDGQRCSSEACIGHAAAQGAPSHGSNVTIAARIPAWRIDFLDNPGKWGHGSSCGVSGSGFQVSGNGSP